jgi:hypothetical protein
VEAGIACSDAAVRAKSFNEIGIIVADELLSLLRGSGEGRTTTDFTDALLHWANYGGCEDDVAWAVRKATEVTNLRIE